MCSPYLNHSIKTHTTCHRTESHPPHMSHVRVRKTKTITIHPPPSMLLTHLPTVHPPPVAVHRSGPPVHPSTHRSSGLRSDVRPRSPVTPIRVRSPIVSEFGSEELEVSQVWSSVFLLDNGPSRKAQGKAAAVRFGHVPLGSTGWTNHWAPVVRWCSLPFYLNTAFLGLAYCPILGQAGC